MSFNNMFQALTLPCGAVLKNRVVKSAMSDSLGDGVGNPTSAQCRLYERWALGGVAASIVGEVQGSADFAEKPGNLVLRADSDLEAFETLAKKGAAEGAQLWLQLGHAGAMSYPPISCPKGPSAIHIPGLDCEALSLAELQAIPGQFALTAKLAEKLGFGGVQIHAAHGFLLSQFLSPLFNKRNDAYGGSLASRVRLLMEVIEAVRASVGSEFVVALKLNSTDQLEGGFDQEDALKVMFMLDKTGIDLIDISGGTYYPGATAASDSSGGGPYFLEFMKHARQQTDIPLMLSGGFKSYAQVETAISSGSIDVAGMARALVLDPGLVGKWSSGIKENPEFPQFSRPPPGAITAWYTMRLTQLGENREISDPAEISSALQQYERRDKERVQMWNRRFSAGEVSRSLCN
jgi:2,4-dienoyl-CoA reductase-like NADH-dependent reductase (Old Yellow Enzyme family)